MIASELIGVWKLMSYVDERDGQEMGRPFGDEPEGFLIYTSDGFISAQLMMPGRSRFQSHDWHAGTAAEYQEAGRGYIGYCGRYEVNEGEAVVTHVPSVAFLPNLIDGRQVRHATLIGDTLTLRTIGLRVDDAVSRLEWKRI